MPLPHGNPLITEITVNYRITVIVYSMRPIRSRPRSADALGVRRAETPNNRRGRNLCPTAVLVY
jgi:hypothetical protein